MQKIAWFLFTVFFGGVFALTAERTFIPLLASREPFSRIPRLTLERVTVVQPKEEIIIDSERLLERSIATVRPTLVRVERRDVRGKVLDAISGVTITADGVVATAASIIGKSGTFHVLHNGDNFPAEFLRYDTEKRIALLRFSASSLPVAAFVEPGKTTLGASVYILRAKPEGERFVPELFVGVITSDGKEDFIETDIAVTDSMAGAPLYAVDGKLLGIVAGNERFISAATLRLALEQGEE